MLVVSIMNKYIFWKSWSSQCALIVCSVSVILFIFWSWTQHISIYNKIFVIIAYARHVSSFVFAFVSLHKKWLLFPPKKKTENLKQQYNNNNNNLKLCVFVVCLSWHRPPGADHQNWLILQFMALGRSNTKRQYINYIIN